MPPDAWRRRRPVFAAIAALALTALVGLAWHGGGLAPEPLYVTQHVAVHLALAFIFGSTLGRGREPLIAALAGRVHRQLTPAMAAYCRAVTRLWTVYFLAMAALSLLLYLAAPFPVWATFANLVTPLGIAALFVGEYLLRYRLHPEFERAGWRDAIRAYARRDAPAAPHEPDRTA